MTWRRWRKTDWRFSPDNDCRNFEIEKFLFKHTVRPLLVGYAMHGQIGRVSIDCFLTMRQKQIILCQSAIFIDSILRNVDFIIQYSQCKVPPSNFTIYRLLKYRSRWPHFDDIMSKCPVFDWSLVSTWPKQTRVSVSQYRAVEGFEEVKP